VNIGDHLNPQRVREAMRALYATGFFRDVELRRDGNVLIVAVAERPSLESVDIKGNKDIKTEDLQKSLRNVGLAAGKTFDRSTLDEVTQYLTDQYYSRGKYAVKIDKKVENLPDNRVRVNIDIKEGSRAKIRQINIVAIRCSKTKPSSRRCRCKRRTGSPGTSRAIATHARRCKGSGEDFDLLPGSRLCEFSYRLGTGSDRAGQERYLHHANITEGAVYKLGEIKLAGNLIAPEAELRRLLFIAPGRSTRRSTSAPRRKPSRTGSAPKVSTSPRSSRCRRWTKRRRSSI